MSPSFQHQISETCERIYDALSAVPSSGLTVRDLAVKLKMKPSDVIRRTATLIKRNLVYMTMTHPDRYFITVGLPKPPVQRKGKKVVVNNGPIPMPPAASTLPSPVTVQKTHWGFVRDCSGSMRSHAEGAKTLFNKQIDELVESERTGRQSHSVTVFDFGLLGGVRNDRIEERLYNVPLNLARLTDYRAEGNTPLIDAVVQTVQRMMCDTRPDMAYVVTVLTDGEENHSRKHNWIDLRRIITERQATDKWTFVFLVPPGYKAGFCRESGVPEGNVQEWSNIHKAEAELTLGTRNYLSARALGRTSSVNYFQPNLSNVNNRDLSQLKEVTGLVKTFEVDKETNVMDFVNAKTGQFQPGRAFYQVMKKEKVVQPYKQLMLQDKQTKRIYMDGPTVSVRQLAGLPTGGNISIEPGNHAGFELFIQSTSTNRILPRGTKLAVYNG